MSLLMGSNPQTMLSRLRDAITPIIKRETDEAVARFSQEMEKRSGEMVDEIISRVADRIKVDPERMRVVVEI